MIFDLLWLDGHSLMELAVRAAARARCTRSGSTARAGARPSTSSGTGEALLEASCRAGARGDRRQAPGLALQAGAALELVGEDQDGRPPGVRDRRLGAGQGQAPGDDRRAAARRLRGRTRCATSGASAAASATQELERLARAAGAAAARAARRSRRVRGPPRGAVFTEPRARRRGRVRRVDRGRQPAPSHLQGAARRQARAARRARGLRSRHALAGDRPRAPTRRALAAAARAEATPAPSPDRCRDRAGRAQGAGERRGPAASRCRTSTRSSIRSAASPSAT